ncbi:hypothetical protein G6F50_016915 [Rhizopus delemar]|uniref:Uncharacterized protein n=1 Tax=Rhizopus delemar TaxID=936053 RepID=A0A9P6XS51_9FUNG|nr:hypothetical protein G6F24_017828 [Rhizopus arrhizus]KAG1531072.1 hypothetical protein G6F50_016915 [Rhizopus delemar]
MLAVTGAVGLQRVRQVVTVLATQLWIGRIDRRIAVRPVAVDAALVGGLALHLGAGFAGGLAACRQAGR